MNQCARKRKFLLHSSRKFSGAALAERFDLLVNRSDKIVRFPGPNAEQGGEEIEILLDRQVRIKRKPAGHVAHARADRKIVVHDVEPIDRGRTAVGGEQRGEQAEQRCFARTVGADQSEQLAFPDGKRHRIECLHPTETL